jgi:DNA uptake protein ComE-like DNA-binding protein
MRAKEPEIRLAPRVPFEEYNIAIKTEANHESDESLLEFNDEADNSYASRSNSIAASRLVHHTSPQTKPFKEEIVFINTPTLSELIARPSLIKQKATALNFHPGK